MFNVKKLNKKQNKINPQIYKKNRKIEKSEMMIKIKTSKVIQLQKY